MAGYGAAIDKVQARLCRGAWGLPVGPDAGEAKDAREDRDLREPAIIHMAIPGLMLQVELRKDPSLSGSAVIISDATGDVRKGLVAAASAEALELDLRPGMAVRRAMKTAPEVIVRRADYRAMEEASEEFFDILRSATPLVETFGPSEAFLSISGRGRQTEEPAALYAAAERLASALQGSVRTDLGLVARAGIGPNKPVARLAGLRATKSGPAVVTPNGAAAFVKGLEIKDLPAMDREDTGRLRDLGITTIGQLAEAPLLFLEKNLGKEKARIIFEICQGRGPMDIHPFHEPGTLSREVIFEKGPAARSLIKETLYVLNEDLTLRLKAAKKTCEKVSLKMTLRDFACNLRTEKLEEETDSINTTWRAALKLLENTPPHTKALLIGLKLH